MRKVLVLFLFIAITVSQAQVRKSRLAGNISLSLEGGLTVAKTDYKTSLPGSSNRGMLEYFLENYNKHNFGLRIFAGGQNIHGEDVRKEFSKFRTGMYYAGAGFTYLYELNNRFIPYASAGLAYNWGSTEQDSPQDNSTLTRTNNFYAMSLETGTRLRIIDNLYFNLSASVNFLNKDLLDNTVLGVNNDFYIKTMAGFSFVLVTRRDADGDGIEDDKDACKNQPEDIDGYEDDDGCPDPDNDKDGILDADDKCPTLAEDPDGFEDNDGCPDLDNDQDGIPDSVDKCINIAEDFDGYQDNDGCAELDNDGDGILDVNDRCPDMPEDFDGYEDNDGCPDLDNDGDGIYDDKDHCPDQPETFNGFEDKDGCPDVAPKKIEPDQYIEPEKPRKEERIIKKEETPKKQDKLTEKENTETRAETESTTPKSGSQKFLLDGVSTFEEESSVISSQAYDDLNRIAEQIKSSKGSRWRIEGYSDNSRSEKESIDFSRKRAQAVYKYLLSKGVSSSQLESIGMGSKNPIESNDRVFGRMRNRRVEIRQVK